MIEERDGIPCDVRKYAFVGNMTIYEIFTALNLKATWDRFGQQDGSLSLFQKYGQTPEDWDLLIQTHDFRHLWNTEMFRAGLADTILSKRFNRKSVAQSYEYDHRSLAEELDAITVPPEFDPLLFGKARDVYKMIMTGRGKGKIADQFKKIQKDEGDEAAIVFLATEADGYHITPYGACLNSFVAEPCPHDLECLAGCVHLYRIGLPREQVALEKLEKRYIDLLDAIDEHPGSNAAKRNAREHAKERLAGIRTAKETQPGDRVFPDGKDLSRPIDGTYRGPFRDTAG